MAKLEPPTDAFATTWLPPVSSHLASAGAGPERDAAVVNPPVGGKREIRKLLHVPSPKTRQDLILAKGVPRPLGDVASFGADTPMGIRIC